ncbi:hypothetical protein HNQ88_000896 [Aureibacter tunicatorum]|uniref:Uncharacterized protein n=1 Tax=Aureibacter tunicatorum TaxID=866807 RepID=A0AAE3XK04_9BACT|nr:hypothetical protein [Aureibacter tunicatorum]BDD02953.1 hypothetical protein AUTU_04360 [Aureibacter tunicatorum]
MNNREQLMFAVLSRYDNYTFSAFKASDSLTLV